MTTWIAIAILGAMPAKPTICIDPGHPSEIGRGTTGKQISELEAAWIVSQDLKARLEQDGYTVVLTKASMDQFVKNRARAEAANKAKAVLMVRLHCDHAVGDTGFATFYATKQGRHEGHTGPSKAVLKRTAIMAPAFHKAAMKELKGSLRDRGLRSDSLTNVGSQYGALIGSIYAEVPSVLVEMAVLSNPKDDAFMASATGQSKMVQALAAGVHAAVPLRN